MNFLLGLSRGLDRLSDKIGAGAGWLTLAMVLIGAYNTLVRYLDRFFHWDLSSNAYIELQWYLFSLVFLFGGAYTLRRGAHVRVDVLYGRLGARGKAWIDLVGTVIFLLPFCIFILWISWPWVSDSWSVREVSSDAGGLPRYPIQAMILVGFALMILQAISEIIKKVAVLRGISADGSPIDDLPLDDLPLDDSRNTPEVAV